MIALINRYVTAFGPSGNEDAVRSLLQADLKQLGADTQIDPLGNLSCVHAPGKDKNRTRVLLMAHMDEIGVMVSHIDERGFCRFLPLGGVRAPWCVGARVRFGNGTIGTIGAEPHEASTALKFDDLYIDIGADDRSAVNVAVGDSACFDRPLEASGQRLIAKSLDDRIGCVVLLETLRRLRSTPHSVAFVFSVQEEMGLRGAGAAAFGFDPHFGIAVDVTRTGDTPKARPMEVALGKGPAIKLRDSGMIADPALVRRLRAAADHAKVAYQLEVLEHGTTDARAIQSARSGVPAGCISIPCRYVHTPSEMVDMRDVEGAIRLLVDLLGRKL